MNLLLACPTCQRHIKRDESACPFCHAPTESTSSPTPRVRRVSRSEWLALGSSLTLVSCTGTSPFGIDGAGAGSGGMSTASSQSQSIGGNQGPFSGTTAIGGSTTTASSSGPLGGTSAWRTSVILPLGDAGTLACGTGYCDGETQVCRSGAPSGEFNCIPYLTVGSTNGTSVCTAPAPFAAATRVR